MGRGAWGEGRGARGAGAGVGRGAWRVARKAGGVGRGAWRVIHHRNASATKSGGRVATGHLDTGLADDAVVRRGGGHNPRGASQEEEHGL